MAIALGAVCMTQAASITVDQIIPDNNTVGLVSSLNLTVPPSAIDTLTVTLNLSSALGDSAWNGDLYAYLRHSSGPLTGFSVLLNRSGLTGSSSVGYGDAGLSVTFSDSAANDIHNYQDYGPFFNAAGQLTGTWQPDARSISPLSPGGDFDSATRPANLGSFTGLDPNGQWVVPESGIPIALIAGLWAGLLLLGYRQRMVAITLHSGAASG